MNTSKQIDELLKLPAGERRRVVQLLEASLREGSEVPPDPGSDKDCSPAAKWLLNRAGRYTGGPGTTAARADEIIRDEIDKRRGLTTK